MTRLVTIISATTVLFGGLLQAQEAKNAASERAMPTMDIVDTAVSAGSFETLVTAVKAAELVETLKGEGPFTVFAPSDSAFAKLPEGTIPALLEDKAKLSSVLTYHVVPGKLMAKDVLGSKWLKTVNGQSLMVHMNGKSPMIDGAKIIKTDIPTTNGVIHVIDTVVLPRADIVTTAVEAGSFKTLATALKAAELVAALQGEGPFTVFAPNDAAFAKLPDGTVEGLLDDPETLKTILTFHVIAGRVLSSDLPVDKTIQPETLMGQSLSIRASKQGVTVNDAKVIKADIICGNGVIHVINSVVLPGEK